MTSQDYFGAGKACLDHGDFLEAVACFEKAILSRGDDEASYLELGNAYLSLGKLSEALIAFQRSLQIRPGWLPPLINIGVVLKEMERFSEAEAVQRLILEQFPDNVDALSNLGAILRRTGRYREALDCYRKVALSCPNEAAALSNMAVIHEDLGDLSQAGRYYKMAVAADPDNAETRFNRSLFLLKTGDYANGWTEYEWRWTARSRHLKPRAYEQPRWQGEGLDGRTVLLHAEQGYGDTLQFVRFASLVGKSSGRVLLRVQPPLVELTRSVKGVDGVIALDAPPPPFDVQLPLLSVPRVLGIGAEGLGMTSPYLSVPPAVVATWADRLGDKARRRVGIFWSGSKANRFRSIPFGALAGLLSLEGVRFYCLQKEVTNEDLRAMERVPELVNPGVEFRSFLDTAAVISLMDLVITIDSSVAHLAGAMGKRCWTLISSPPDWRWATQGEDSAWYPSMKLFRQTTSGQWSDVLARVVGALAALS